MYFDVCIRVVHDLVRKRSGFLAISMGIPRALLSTTEPPKADARLNRCYHVDGDIHCTPSHCAVVVRE